MLWVELYYLKIYIEILTSNISHLFAVNFFLETGSLHMELVKSGWGHFIYMLFSLYMVLCFFFFYLVLISSFISLRSIKMLGIISILLNLLWLFCSLACDLSWIMYHMYWKRMCVLLFGVEMSYRYLSN